METSCYACICICGGFMFLFSFQTVSKFMCFTGSEKEHCIDSHVLYLDLEMTPFFVYDQFSVQNKKRNCYFSLFPWRCKDGP